MTNCTLKPLSPQACDRSQSHILDSFDYHNVRGVREKAILNQTLTDGKNGNTKIFCLTDSTGEITGKLGIVALSVGRLELDDKPFPIVRIDYLFVDNKHRKEVYPHLGDKASRILLIYAIQSAVRIAEIAGVRYLMLSPDGGREHTNLITFYESMKFKYLSPHHDWMCLKLN